MLSPQALTHCPHCLGSLHDCQGPTEWLDVSAEVPIVTRGTRQIKLTGMEFAVFEAMLRAKGRTMSTDAIFNVVYSDRLDPPANAEIIKIYIWKLRRKVDKLAIRIPLTGYGVGYRIELLPC